MPLRPPAGDSSSSKRARPITAVVVKKPKKKEPRGRVNLGLGFPQQSKFIHRYATADFTLTNTTSGAISFAQYWCNGMFDPQLALGGQQPMNFDQMAALYDHYTVVSSKIWVRFVPTEGKDVVCGVFVNDGSGTAAFVDWEDANETPQNLGNVLLTGLDWRQKSVSGSWNAYKLFGPDPLDNDELKGSGSANPQEDQYFCLYAQALEKTIFYTVKAQILIEYTAIWTEPKKVSGS